MSRTTLDIDPTVLRELRLRAKAAGKSMGQIASEVLAQALGEAEATSVPAFEWSSADLGRPLVDLEDKEAVGTILEDRQ